MAKREALEQAVEEARAVIGEYLSGFITADEAMDRMKDILDLDKLEGRT
jgi:hypothetical protein